MTTAGLIDPPDLCEPASSKWRHALPELAKDAIFHSMSMMGHAMNRQTHVFQATAIDSERFSGAPLS